MEVKAYFNEACRSAIEAELQKAEKEIIVAVAWFNDQDLFRILLEKADQGVSVNLLISNDPTNFEKPESLNFEKLLAKKGKVNRLITNDFFMHNKFCVIDDSTIITGSYNWTFGAFNKNLENIVVIKEADELGKRYKGEFERILQEYFTYIRDFKQLLQDIQGKIGELMAKAETLDPNYIISALSKPGEAIFGSSGGSHDPIHDYFSGYSQTPSDWWEEIPEDWKKYFNDVILKKGRIDNKPPEDAIKYLQSLDEIECSGYYQSLQNNQRNYYITSLNGLAKLSHLKKVKITSSSLTQSKIEAINDLKGLTHLDLSGNSISALPLNYPLANLIELNISSNNFESLDFLPNLPSLEVLHCQSNKIAGIKGLESAKKLRIIYIDIKVFELPFIQSKVLELGFEQRDFENRNVVKLERVS